MKRVLFLSVTFLLIGCGSPAQKSETNTTTPIPTSTTSPLPNIDDSAKKPPQIPTL